MLVAFCDCCSNMALMPVWKFNMIRKRNCITKGLYSLSILIWLKCFSSVAFHNRFIAKPGSKATSPLICPRSKYQMGSLIVYFIHHHIKLGPNYRPSSFAFSAAAHWEMVCGTVWGWLRFNTCMVYEQKKGILGLAVWWFCTTIHYASGVKQSCWMKPLHSRGYPVGYGSTALGKPSSETRVSDCSWCVDMNGCSYSWRDGDGCSARHPRLSHFWDHNLWFPWSQSWCLRPWQAAAGCKAATMSLPLLFKSKPRSHCG